jgi:hypothetical protein
MEDYLGSAIKQFEYYKSLGEGTINQLSEEQLYWSDCRESNSIAIIVKHLSGNMLSRWTDFLNSDGEKPWRNREDEFDLTDTNKTEIMLRWQRGWDCLLGTLNGLQSQDMDRIVYIRNMGHSVVEAINRQLCHYAYHIGQIVYIGKILKKEKWQSLSIPRGQSESYNAQNFAQAKRRKHFTDDL